jgi:hypothetical protein
VASSGPSACDNPEGGKVGLPVGSEGIDSGVEVPTEAGTGSEGIDIMVEVPAKAGTGAYEVSEGVGEDTNGEAGSEEEGAKGSIRRSGMRADV